MGWFKPSELNCNVRLKFKYCQCATNSKLMTYDPKRKKYRVNEDWRALLILRGNPIISERKTVEAGREQDRPLLTQAEKQQLAQTTVMSALRSRKPLELVWGAI